MQNTEKMFGGGSKNAISNGGGEKEQGKARWKGVRYSRIAHCLDFWNYTLFYVLRQNLCVKWCNLLSFTSVTLRPLKKRRSSFPFNENCLAQEFSSWHFFVLLRSRLHRDVLVQILSFCSFRVALCLASTLLTQGFLYPSLLVWISRQLLHVFIFLSWQHTHQEKKKTFKSIFPSAIRHGWLRPH